MRQPINFNAPIADQLAPLSINNPFNPYGSRFYSPTGAPNADGTPRLTGTPQPVTLLALALVENGAEDVDVNSGVYRGVAGLRGQGFRSMDLGSGCALHARVHVRHFESRGA